MKTIMTVLGPIAAADLGYCQMHEHIFVLPTPNSVKYPALEISDEKASLRELIAYRKSGGEAMLDAQPIGAGRDIAALKRLSAGSGVHIIYYNADVTPGAVALEDISEEMYALALENKRSEYYNEQLLAWVEALNPVYHEDAWVVG